MTASCLYAGSVRHRRFAPRPHRFRYRLNLLYLDLDELPSLFRDRWLWANEGRALASFRRADHFGDPGVPLKDAVRALVAERTGQIVDGPIRLLTHPRYFGYVFNPVSFFYCFDASGSRLEAILAEVSNTPWGERHCYVLGEAANRGSERKKRYRFAKDFHVSPFLGMEYEYDWRFVAPAQQLLVHMENKSGGAVAFDATLCLRRRELSASALAFALVRYPAMTAQVSAAIYFEALRLWAKRAPFFAHPRYATGRGVAAVSASRLSPSLRDQPMQEGRR